MPNPGYLALLRHPRGRVPWLAAMLGRLVVGMSIVSIVLLVRRSGQSFGIAGLAAGVGSLGTAAGSPIWGRMIDRRGPVRVLPALGVAYLAATVAIGLVTDGETPAALLCAMTFTAGAVFPPVSAVVRVGWRALYGQQLRDRAFALDSVTVELGFTIGPILAAFLVDAVAPRAGIIAAGVFMLTSVLAFSSTGLAKEMIGTPAVMGAGALRVGAVRTVMAIAASIAIGFGTIDILAPAVAEDAGRPGAAGIVLAAFALGSAVGGIVYGARSWPSTRVRRLQAMTATVTITFSLLILGQSSLVLFIPLAMLAGVMIAPIVVICFSLVDDLAPRTAVTEAVTWVSTSIMLGGAAGAAISGQLVESRGTTAAILGGCAGLALAVVVVSTAAGSLGRADDVNRRSGTSTSSDG